MPENKRDRKFYWQLFRETFALSAFTFGGGYVIVPLMRKKFAEKLGWISEEEMLNFVVIAQSSPGAIAVNASILVGHHLAGVPGALLSVAGTVLPPLIIISALVGIYTAFRDNVIVNAAMLGMRIGVAAVLVDVIISMVSGIIKTKSLLSCVVLVASFIAVYCFKVHVLLVFVCCMLIGIASALHQKHRKKESIL